MTDNIEVFVNLNQIKMGFYLSDDLKILFNA